MKYPIFLKLGDTIGLTAPSFGITVEPYITRFKAAKEKLSTLGYNFIETPHVHKNYKGASCSAQTRAEEFLSLWQDNNVDFIFSVAGGELMMEILPFIDFTQLTKYPVKFFMGYSDNTFLTFLLTTLSDIATIYSHNFPHFGTKPWHRELKDAMNIITGKKLVQKNYARYINEEKEDKTNPLASPHHSKLVKWKSLNNEKSFELNGRIIGGCLDCLVSIVGTSFDKIKEFNEKYSEDGIIFFFESCELNVFGLSRALVQLINAGWFNHCKGIVIGRPSGIKTIMGLSYTDVLKEHLLPLNIPIIYDVDIGHVPPRMTIINGSIIKLKYQNGKSTLETFLR